MSDTLIGEMEVAIVKAIVEAESYANDGRTLTDDQRQVFKLGFIAGSRHGIAIAQEALRETMK